MAVAVCWADGGSALPAPKGAQPAFAEVQEDIVDDMRASVRINEANPCHHLYWNNGTWWVHYTVHLADYTKRRLRQSLRTRDLEVAKARRDAILRQLEEGAMFGGEWSRCWQQERWIQSENEAWSDLKASR